MSEESQVAKVSRLMGMLTNRRVQRKSVSYFTIRRLAKNGGSVFPYEEFLAAGRAIKRAKLGTLHVSNRADDTRVTLFNPRAVIGALQASNALPTPKAAPAPVASAASEAAEPTTDLEPQDTRSRAIAECLSGHPIPATARKYGINQASLYRWVGQAGTKGGMSYIPPGQDDVGEFLDAAKAHEQAAEALRKLYQLQMARRTFRAQTKR